MVLFFSSGAIQAQCQCDSGMSWNGVAVSVEKFSKSSMLFSILF